MATKYLYKYRSSNAWSADIDFGQLIIDNPTNPLLGGKNAQSIDDFQAYVEGAPPDGLGDPIDTDANGIRHIVIDFEKREDISVFNQFSPAPNNDIDTTNFDTLFVNGESTVQDCLDKLDDSVVATVKYYETDTGATIDVTQKVNVIRFDGLNPATQQLPDLTLVQEGTRVFVENLKSDESEVTIAAFSGQQVVGGSTYGLDYQQWIEIVANPDAPSIPNWELLGNSSSSIAPTVGIELDDGTTNIASVEKITYDKAVISGTPANVTVSPQISFAMSYPPYTVKVGKELSLQPPLELQAAETDPVLNINPGAFEGQHAPSYYASLSDDLEVVGYISGGIRTGVLWFDNVIKPAGAYIQIDKNNKSIGLQEDDNLDPNITGGTPYFIYTRISMRGTALADGFVTFYIRDLLTKDIIEDDNGRLLAVNKSYKTGDELGALDIAAIKKFTGIEQFQICVDENFGVDGNIVIEDRTEGNSCVLVQAIEQTNQTSRGILQCENDINKNFEWTSHYIGSDFIDLEYFLKEDRPLTSILVGEGELSADGWDLNNFTPMKVGTASNTLTFEDDGSNLLGFSFGNIITAEKTKLLRNKSVNAFITLTTPQGAGRVYAAKWTGTPDAFTREIITDIDPSGTPVMGANWVLDGVSIFCTEDVSGDPNDYSGAFTIPSDAENWAVFFAPGEKEQPSKFEITDFHVDKDPAISGFYLYAPEEPGESYLIEDTEYAEFGLNTRPIVDGKKQSYAGLRYTINIADTPLPAGQLIKGKADIEGNWDGLGGAVDFLTFNAKGNASISTSFIVYPGESVPGGGTSTNKFWWSYESPPGTWNKIPESEITHTAVKDVTVPQTVTIPSFNYKVQIGDKLRCFANSSIDDGAFIESKSPSEYLCETTIRFTEFVPGSEDEPVTSLWVEDDLTNLWELTAETDGRLLTLLQDDLPENQKRHVIQDDFSLNDFAFVGDAISLTSPSGANYSQEPTGYALDDASGEIDLDSSEMSFANGTRTFTIQPKAPATEFITVQSGVEYAFETAQTVVIDDTEGIHFIYFDEGVLYSTTTFDINIIYSKVFTAVLYWDQTNQECIYLGEERHGLKMDGHTHSRLHQKDGTIYITGLGLGDFVLGNGSLDTHAQFSAATGQIKDEDILETLSSIASTVGLPIFYKEGATGVWRREFNSGYSVINATAGGNRVVWNEFTGGAWQKTEATNNDYVLYHIFATNDINYPFFSIMGQNEYATSNAAKDAAFEELNSLILSNLPIVEFVAVGSVLFQTGSYGNSANARIVSPDGSANYVDWRFSDIARSGFVSTEHNNLSGIQGGTTNEYYHLTSANHNALTDFNAQTAKTSIVNADVILIEDSADSYNKKKTTYGDMLSSFQTERPMGGGYYNGTGIVRECTSQNTFYKAVITFTAWDNLVDFSWNGTDNRFEYDGDGGDFHIVLDFTAGSDTNNVDYTFKVYKNGTAISGIDAIRNVDANKSGRIGLNGMATLATDDYIEVYVASNSTEAPEITFLNVQITIR